MFRRCHWDHKRGRNGEKGVKRFARKEWREQEDGPVFRGRHLKKQYKGRKQRRKHRESFKYHEPAWRQSRHWLDDDDNYDLPAWQPFDFANEPQGVLPCGLTMAQVQALQGRELSPEDYELLLQLDEMVPNKTLEADAVEGLLVKEESAEAGAKAQQSFTPVDCGVCLSEVETVAELVRLPCTHAFHEVCVTKWLTKYGTTCPFKCSLEPDKESKESE